MTRACRPTRTPATAGLPSHRLDAARLFRLAVESAPASRVLHGVVEEDLLGWRPTQSGLLADLDHDDYVVS